MEFSNNIIVSYIEEDNEQHSLFHVRPLLDMNGPISEDAISSFKDTGYLRIAPDKKEQYSFKERMRSLGKFCVINLFGVEEGAGKIRPNRNYAPQFGEVHQFIIYSDVVQPLPKDLVYEVVTGGVEGKPIVQSATPTCYLRNGGRIQGPYNAADGSLSNNLVAIRPDSPSLFAVTLPNGQERLFYWPGSEQTSSVERVRLMDKTLDNSNEDTGEKSETAKAPSKKINTERTGFASARRIKENIKGGMSYKPVATPLDTLRRVIPSVVNSETMLQDAVSYLLSIPQFKNSINKRLKSSDKESPLITAFNEQLNSLEAERLRLIMEIEKAKGDEKAYAERVLGEITSQEKDKLDNLQKKITEIEQSLNSIKKEQSQLIDMRNSIAGEISLLNNKPLVLRREGEVEPVIYSVQRLREHIQNAGFDISIDSARYLLTLLLLEPQVQLCTASLADSGILAAAIANALGVPQSYCLDDDENIASFNGGNGFSFAVVSRGSRQPSSFTRLILSDKAEPFGKAYRYMPWPCYYLEGQKTKQGFVKPLPCDKPISAEALIEELIINTAEKLTYEAEKILNGTIKNIEEQGCILPVSLYQRMQNVILALSNHVEGGITKALDFAIASYLIPFAKNNKIKLQIPEDILVNLNITKEIP